MSEDVSSFASPMLGADAQHDPYAQLPPAPQPPANASLLSRAWRSLVDASRVMDEAAGFDTTKGGSGTRPPPRSEHPTAAVVGDAVAKAAGIVGSATDQLTFGLSGKANSYIPGQMNEANNQAQERFEVKHPELDTIARATGAIPSVALADAALAKYLPYATAFNNPFARKAADTAMASTRGAVIGGGMGAGTDKEDAAQGAIQGAAAGAAVPAGLGMLSLFGKPAMEAIGARLSPAYARQQAAAKIADAFNRDEITADQARQMLARLGPEAGLIDVGGPNVKGVGEGVANLPGKGQTQAVNFLEGRMEGAPGRINAAVKTATGSQDDFYVNLDNTVARRAADAGPRYEETFRRIIPTQDEADSVQRFIKDPIGQRALSRGVRLIEMGKTTANQPFDPADYGVTRVGDEGFELGAGTPNLRLFDAVKRGYDAEVNANRNPVTGKLTEYGREADQMRRAYVQQLRDMYPRYANTLDAWSGPTRALEALQQGRDALNNDAEVTTAMIKAMSPNERDFFLSGVSRALKDRVMKTADGADATRKIFGNSEIRERVAAAFDDPAKFAEFQRTMEAENTFAKTRNRLVMGSPSARRLAAMKDVDYTAPGMMLATGHPGAAALSVLQQQAVANPGVDTHPVRTEIARSLFGQPGSQYFTTLQKAQNAQLTPLVRVPSQATAIAEATQPSEEWRKRREGILGRLSPD